MAGIINFEAIIFLLAYLALTGLLINFLVNVNEKMEEKKELFSAKSSVSRCTLIADSIYSNSGGKVKVKENCFFEDGKMKSRKGKEKAEEETLTEKITTSNKGIEIGVEDHYK